MRNFQQIVKQAALLALEDNDLVFLEIIWHQQLWQHPEYFWLLKWNKQSEDELIKQDHELKYSLELGKLLFQHAQLFIDQNGRIDRAHIEEIKARITQDLKVLHEQIKITIDEKIAGTEGYYCEDSDTYQYIGYGEDGLLPEEKAQRKAKMQQYQVAFMQKLDTEFTEFTQKYASLLDDYLNLFDAIVSVNEPTKILMSRVEQLRQESEAINMIRAELEQYHSEIVKAHRNESIATWVAAMSEQGNSRVYNFLREQIGALSAQAPNMPADPREQVKQVLGRIGLWCQDVVDAESGDTLLHAAVRFGKDQALCQLLSRRALTEQAFYDSTTGSAGTGKSLLHSQIVQQRLDAVLGRSTVLQNAIYDSFSGSPKQLDACPTWHEKFKAMLLSLACEFQFDLEVVNAVGLFFSMLQGPDGSGALHYLMQNNANAMALRITESVLLEMVRAEDPFGVEPELSCAKRARAYFTKKNNARNPVTCLEAINSRGETLPLVALRYGKTQWLLPYLIAQGLIPEPILYGDTPQLDYDAMRRHIAGLLATTNTLVPLIPKDAKDPEDLRNTVRRICDVRMQEGLELKRIHKGHCCLFEAISIGLEGPTATEEQIAARVEQLRRAVVDDLLVHSQQNAQFFGGTFHDYHCALERILSGNEDGSELEWVAVQRVLGRPIIILRSEQAPIIRADSTQYTGLPIFVYADVACQHYDGIVVQAGYDPAMILQVLSMQRCESIRPTVVRSALSVLEYLTARNPDRTYVYPVDSAIRRILLQVICRPLETEFFSEQDHVASDIRGPLSPFEQDVREVLCRQIAQLPPQNAGFFTRWRHGHFSAVSFRAYRLQQLRRLQEMAFQLQVSHLRGNDEDLGVAVHEVVMTGSLPQRTVTAELAQLKQRALTEDKYALAILVPQQFIITQALAAANEQRERADQERQRRERSEERTRQEREEKERSQERERQERQEKEQAQAQVEVVQQENAELRQETTEEKAKRIKAERRAEKAQRRAEILQKKLEALGVALEESDSEVEVEPEVQAQEATAAMGASAAAGGLFAHTATVLTGEVNQAAAGSAEHTADDADDEADAHGAAAVTSRESSPGSTH